MDVGLGGYIVPILAQNISQLRRRRLQGQTWKRAIGGDRCSCELWDGRADARPSVSGGSTTNFHPIFRSAITHAKQALGCTSAAATTGGGKEARLFSSDPNLPHNERASRPI